MLTLLYLLILIRILSGQDISAITDLQTLSELPLEKLLKLKNNFDPKEELHKDVISTKLDTNLGEPEALPFHYKRNPHQRDGYEEEQWRNKGSKKDASTIFQMSVTTLSFIAFGGYLLCLIVQAIRAKNNMNGTDMMAMLVRPSKFKKNRNTVKYTQTNKRPVSNRYKREVWQDGDPQGMYNALLTLAEGYSKYHSVDYKHFNETFNYFV